MHDSRLRRRTAIRAHRMCTGHPGRDHRTRFERNRRSRRTLRPAPSVSTAAKLLGHPMPKGCGRCAPGRLRRDCRATTSAACARARARARPAEEGDGSGGSSIGSTCQCDGRQGEGRRAPRVDPRLPKATGALDGSLGEPLAALAAAAVGKALGCRKSSCWRQENPWQWQPGEPLAARMALDSRLVRQARQAASDCLGTVDTLCHDSAGDRTLKDEPSAPCRSRRRRRVTAGQVDG